MDDPVDGPPAFDFVSVGQAQQGGRLAVALAIHGAVAAVSPEAARVLAKQLEAWADVVESDQERSQERAATE